MIKIRVTGEDIKKGSELVNRNKSNMKWCPIALAIRRVTNKSVKVGGIVLHLKIVIDNHFYKVVGEKQEEMVRLFVTGFDNLLDKSYNVKPIEFVIERC